MGFFDAAAAMDALERDHDRFDLMIMEEGADHDLQGLTLAIRRALPSGRRLILSGRRANLEAHALERIDAYACIGRPWQAALVASTLHEALRAGQAS